MKEKQKLFNIERDMMSLINQRAFEIFHCQDNDHTSTLGGPMASLIYNLYKDSLGSRAYTFLS